MDIKKLLRKHLMENHHLDQALDTMLKQGGDFSRMSDLHKLILLAPSGDIAKLKNLSLSNIFKEMGGTFGQFQVKVKVKDVNQQPIRHKFSLEHAGKEGFLYSAMHHDNQSGESYGIVRFKDFQHDAKMYGGGAYDECPIMLKNIYPIGFDDIDGEFSDYQNKQDFERDEFKKNMGF